MANDEAGTKISLVSKIPNPRKSRGRKTYVIVY